MDRCLGIRAPLILREHGWKIELHRDHFKDDVYDEDWIPVVASRGWVILTKDKALQRKEVEWAAIQTCRASVLTLPNGNLTGQLMAEYFLENRLKIGRFLKDQAPPFVACVLRDGVELRRAAGPLSPGN